MIKLKKEEIAEFAKNRLERPCTSRTMMRMLKIDKKYRIQFQNILNSLVHEGSLIKIKGNRYASPSKIDLVIGRFEIHRDGSYGFVIPDDAGKQDVFIRTEDSLRALPGDKVVARIESYRAAAGPRGRIIRILEEYLNFIVGRFEARETYNVVLPFDRRVSQEVFIPEGMENGAEDGVYVKAEITSRSKTSSMLVGKITSVLGRISDPGVDRIIVQNQFGVKTVFPSEVLKEADSTVKKHKKLSIEARQDYRNQKAVTIDGEDARDFDDAVFLESNGNGWHLYVHIADVSEFVKSGTKLDHEAYIRGCSVYFPETAVPMLPEPISNGSCSLKPREDRLAVTCKLSIGSTGKVESAEFTRSIIRSEARLTYTQVFDSITSKTSDGIDPEIAVMLSEMYKISQKIRKNRLRKGYIDFNLPEVTVKMGDEGEVLSIVKEETNDAHRIIEEFMISANEAVAEFLLSSGSPALFRIHERPDAAKISSFMQIYRGLGYDYHLDIDSITPVDFTKMLTKVKGSVYDLMLSRMMLRSMKLARYSPKNLGHFGLASTAYTHFTSPIRRYPDLVVHRELKNLIEQGKTYINLKKMRDTEKEAAEDKSLLNIASHCSITERHADEAERELIRWRQVRYMENLVGEIFDAVIIDVISYGIYIELSDYYLEGLIHISSIYDDYYHYDERSKSLWGEKTHKKYSIGQTIEVLIAKIDVEKRMIDFAPHGLDLRRKMKSTRRRRR